MNEKNADVISIDSWKLVVPAMIAVVLVTAYISFYLPSAMRSSAIETAYRTSLQLATQYKTTRSFYSNVVAARVKEQGDIPFAADYTADDESIPFPTTFIMDIAELLSKENVRLSLTSPYPWPNRAGRQLTAFQKDAWTSLQERPESVVSREETIDGQRVLKVAVADRMVSESCVACHNSSPNSPKRDWHLNDVRAVMEVSTTMEPYLARADRQSKAIIHTVQAVAGLVIAALALLGYVSLRRKKEKEEALRNLHFHAHHDTMTGTLKRSSFIDVLQERLQCDATQSLALHYVDLDRFKEINDRYGHAAGDTLVKEAAERLKEAAGENGMVGRVGGDEFLVAHANVADQHALEVSASAIIDCLKAPFDLQGNTVQVSASVGSVICRHVREGIELFIQRADLALYKAKASGRNRFQVYDETLGEAHGDSRKLKDAIFNAMRNDTFTLHFQGIFNAESGRLEGFEALLRLSDENGKSISPDVFIPVAEAMGAISEIGAWVLDQACAFSAQLPGDIFVSVNLSPAQFAGGDIPTLVLTALEKHRLSSNKLELEITENLFLERTEQVIAELAKLREMGISIAIDDFGTGYSNLSYFCDLPLTKVKIDRSFLAGWARGEAAAESVLQTIMTLCRNTRMAVTAEGVETQEQAAYCRSIGCQQLQGFLLARPVPAGDLAPFLQKLAIEGFALDTSETDDALDTEFERHD